VVVELQLSKDATAPVDARAFLPVELVCTVCGYGAVARRAPLSCPMCRSDAWEPAAWRPFTARYDLEGAEFE
jgi:rubrerythrin